MGVKNLRSDKLSLYLIIILLFTSSFPVILNASKPNARLFPESPIVDLVIMTPMWPTVAGGPESFSFDNIQPGGIATDGYYLYVADTMNHRVLVFDVKSLKAVKIIGQKDAYSRIPSDDKYGLNCPGGIDTDGKWLFIADRANFRLVVYDLESFIPIVIILPYNEIWDLAWDGKWLYTTIKSLHIVVVYTNISRILNGDYKPIERSEYIILGEEGVGGCSRTLMDEPVGIDVDEEYLYVTDRRNGRVLIWSKKNLRDHVPADYILGYKDPECKMPVENPAGIIRETYDVASNERYIFVHDTNRILVFDKNELADGALAKYVIGKEKFDDFTPTRNPTKNTLGGNPRGLAADEKFLYVVEKGFYVQAILRFNLTELRSGIEADRILGILWHRNPKYGLEIANGKMFVAGQEYLGVFNKIPDENYAYPDFYIPIGAVEVSSDGQHLCVISKSGEIAIYNEIPNEAREPDIIINIPGVTGGGAASGISCHDGKLAATNSFWEQSKVLVWKSIPTRNNQPPDVILTEFNGERITEPFNVYIYQDILFIALHIGSKVLIYKNLDRLSNESNPDIILGESEGLYGGIRDIYYDGKYLFVSTGSGIYIYHGLPESPRKADEVISEVNISGVRFKLDPWGIYFDGEYLWVFNGCSEHYSFIIRIPISKTEPVYPDKLIRDDFKEYLEKGSSILSQCLDLMASGLSPEEISNRLMGEIPEFLRIFWEINYLPLIEKSKEQIPHIEERIPKEYEELSRAYHELLKKYEEVNLTYCMLKKEYENLRESYESLKLSYNETLNQLEVLKQRNKATTQKLKIMMNELLLYKNLTYVFATSTVILAVFTFLQVMKRLHSSKQG